jgi:ribose 1,5-bisphosphokinase
MSKQDARKGALFLLIGNSGSGKDSLIEWVLKNWPNGKDPPFMPTRVITRPPSPETEEFKSVSEAEFHELSEKGAFSLQWKSYGIYYGVSKQIEIMMGQGRTVLVNVSRQIVEKTRTQFPNVLVVFVKVPFQITEARLRARGREHGTALEDRIERARQNQEFPGADYIVDNSGDLESAGRQLLAILLQHQ